MQGKRLLCEDQTWHWAGLVYNCSDLCQGSSIDEQTVTIYVADQVRK
jgi:hypothetical protein